MACGAAGSPGRGIRPERRSAARKAQNGTPVHPLLRRYVPRGNRHLPRRAPPAGADGALRQPARLGGVDGLGLRDRLLRHRGVRRSGVRPLRPAARARRRHERLLRGDGRLRAGLDAVADDRPPRPGGGVRGRRRPAGVGCDPPARASRAGRRGDGRADGRPDGRPTRGRARGKPARRRLDGRPVPRRRRRGRGDVPRSVAVVSARAAAGLEDPRDRPIRRPSGRTGGSLALRGLLRLPARQLRRPVLRADLVLHGLRPGRDGGRLRHDRPGHRQHPGRTGGAAHRRPMGDRPDAPRLHARLPRLLSGPAVERKPGRGPRRPVRRLLHRRDPIPRVHGALAVADGNRAGDGRPLSATGQGTGRCGGCAADR